MFEVAELDKVSNFMSAIWILESLWRALLSGFIQAGQVLSHQVPIPFDRNCQSLLYQTNGR